MNFSLLRNFVEKINLIFCGRKNSNGNDNRVEGNNNNIGNLTIYNNYYEKESKIELSEQAKRIYEEFKKSEYHYLSVFFDDEIEFAENGKNGLTIDNLDKRMVKADVDNLVKCGYLRFDHKQKNVADFYTLAK